MEAQAYLDLLQNRLQRFFDNKPLPTNLPYTLVAELNASDEGYFLVPSIKTYCVKHNEYLYAHVFNEPLFMTQVLPYLDHLKKQMQELQTTTEHMSSLFAMLFICEHGIDAATLAELEKTKYHKDYCFTLKGWSDLAIYVVDLKKEKLYCNKAGRKTAGYFDFVALK